MATIWFPCGKLPSFDVDFHTFPQEMILHSLTHSCWLLDTLFDHLLWITISILYKSCHSPLRNINLLVTHLIKHCNKTKVVNRITVENVSVNIWGCLLSPQFTYHSQHIWLVFPWKMFIFCSITSTCFWSAYSQWLGQPVTCTTNDYGTTLIPDLLSSTFALRFSCLWSLYLQLCWTFLSYTLDSTASTSLLTSVWL